MCANMWKEHQMIQELLSPHMRENITMKCQSRTQIQWPPKQIHCPLKVKTSDDELAPWIENFINPSFDQSDGVQSSRATEAKRLKQSAMVDNFSCESHEFLMKTAFFFFLVFSFLWVSKSISRWDKLTLNLSYHFTLFFWSSPFCG